jgi:hypothetical protein
VKFKTQNTFLPKYDVVVVEFVADVVVVELR